MESAPPRAPAGEDPTPLIPAAFILFADHEEYIVMCPHCEMFHKHKQTGIPNEIKSAYCGKGNYSLGQVVNPRDLQRALKRRNYELEKKRKPNVLSIQ